MLKKILLASVASATLLTGSLSHAAADTPFHNASYDIARELFGEINPCSSSTGSSRAARK